MDNGKEIIVGQYKLIYCIDDINDDGCLEEWYQVYIDDDFKGYISYELYRLDITETEIENLL